MNNNLPDSNELRLFESYKRRALFAVNYLKRTGIKSADVERSRTLSDYNISRLLDIGLSASFLSRYGAGRIADIVQYRMGPLDEIATAHLLE